MRAVTIVRRAIVIMLLLLLRLVRLTSALRFGGRRTVDRIERLMAATLVRSMTTMQLRLGQTTIRPEWIGIEDRHLACALSLLLTFGLARGKIAARRIVTALQLIVRLAGTPATDGIERLVAAAQSPRRAPSTAVQLGRAVR